MSNALTLAELAKKQPKAVSRFLDNIGAIQAPEMPDNVGTLAGGAIGAMVFPNHRILGLVGGASLGRNLPMLLSEHKGAAVRNMAMTGTAIAGALVGSSGRKTTTGKAVGAVVGFSIGWIVAGAVDAYRRNR
jgi:hypothetical protein